MLDGAMLGIAGAAVGVTVAAVLAKLVGVELKRMLSGSERRSLYRSHYHVEVPFSFLYLRSLATDSMCSFPML